VVCWPPVAVSPDTCVSAVLRGAPVNPNTLTKPGGSVPPLLKNLLSEVAMFCWLRLTVEPVAIPSTALRLSSTLLLV